VNRFIVWISILCAAAILVVGNDFLAPVLSGLVLAFGLRPFEDSFVFKKIPSARARTFTLLLSFMAVFGTLGTYVVIASAKGIARNVDLKKIQGSTGQEVEKGAVKDDFLSPDYMDTEDKDDPQRKPDAASEGASSVVSKDSENAEGEAVENVGNSEGILDKARHLLEKIPGLNADEIKKIWSEMFSRVQGLALVVLSKILTAGPAIVIQWIVFLIAFVVFFLNYENLLSFFHSFEKKNKDVRQCVKFFQNATQATLMGTLVVGTAQASIITIGTAIAGFESFVLLGLCAFFASFVPFFGTAIVWVSALIYSLVAGDTEAAIIVGVAGGMSSVADNLILPTFIGSQNKVHPLLLFVVVIGLIEMIGIWGLFIGPVLAIFSTRVFELWYKQENLA